MIIKNVICPQCRLTWLVPLRLDTYYCYACNYVMLEKQISKEHQFYAVHSKQSEATDTI